MIWSNIESVKSAELVDIEKGKEIVLEIKGKDEKKFRIYMEKSYLIYAIKDMESGEYVYAVVK